MHQLAQLYSIYTQGVEVNYWDTTSEQRPQDVHHVGQLYAVSRWQANALFIHTDQTIEISILPRRNDNHSETWSVRFLVVNHVLTWSAIKNHAQKHSLPLSIIIHVHISSNFKAMLILQYVTIMLCQCES